MFKRSGFGLCCVRHVHVRKTQRNGIQRVMKYRLRQAITAHRNHACPDYALVATLEPSAEVTKMLACRCRTTRAFKRSARYHDRMVRNCNRKSMQEAS